MRRRRIPLACLGVLIAGSVAASSGAPAGVAAADHGGAATTTPIQHLVVIFQENVSFDHYFGTYPLAANTDGSRFAASPDTPGVNGLSPSLLTSNPNGANPHRLSPAQALTCDQNHDYTAEQQAFDHGAMDRFVQFTNNNSCSHPVPDGTPVMDYYDGNTVTALWNYAQHFALNDNSYNTVFGPSTPGALNLVSGQTHGALPSTAVPGEVDNDTVIGDPDPTYDDCSKGTKVAMTGRNVGDLLDSRGISWGFFQGGFRPTSTSGGTAVCGASHTNIGGATVTDYSAHHQPFQYYRSTANPHHVAPASAAEIGHDGQANHQYDLADFTTALSGGQLPAVTFLKAAKYQDGHPGYSDPLDEQHFVVETINQLMRSKEWRSTAVVIAYDDSDGWYDHQAAPLVNPSQSTDDALTAPGQCGAGQPAGGYQDRCGYGPRTPLLVISPFSRVNAVDHTVTDQTSILRFVEDNWSLGRIGDSSFDAAAGPLTAALDFDHPRAKELLLDPQTGEPLH